MKIIYNIPNIIRMAGMERILAIKANYLAGLTGMEVVIITYEQKNLPLAFDFSDKIRFYDLDIDYAACRGKNIFWKMIFTQTPLVITEIFTRTITSQGSAPSLTITKQSIRNMRMSLRKRIMMNQTM